MIPSFHIEIQASLFLLVLWHKFLWTIKLCPCNCFVHLILNIRYNDFICVWVSAIKNFVLVLVILYSFIWKMCNGYLCRTEEWMELITKKVYRPCAPPSTFPTFTMVMIQVYKFDLIIKKLLSYLFVTSQVCFLIKGSRVTSDLIKFDSSKWNKLLVNNDDFQSWININKWHY